MIKTIGFLMLWAIGSVAAVAVAWAGVEVVSDELVNPAPATNLAIGPSPNAGPGPASSLVDSTTSSIATGSPTTSSTLPDSVPTTTPASSQQGTDPPTTSSTTVSGAGATPSTSSSSSTSSTSSTSTSTTAPPSQPAQTQTFNLIGGSTAISFSASGVEVLWATPNPGFTVTIEPEDPGLKVEFRSDSHRSRVDAWWANGPAHDLREEDD